MTRYIETFFRHKVLLLTPLVLTLLVSVWYVSQQPTTYTASTTVWFDTQAPGPAYFDVTNFIPQPAGQAQTVLTQLLTTKDFLVKAANRGPLAGASGQAASSSTDKVAAELGSSVTAYAVGPQVLRLLTTNGNPTVATKQLQGVLDQFFDELKSIRTDRDGASINYYQPRVDSATDTLNKAQAAQIAYLADHPQAAAAGASADPQYAALSGAVVSAQAQFMDADKALTQAKQALATDQASATSHVIDPPGDAVANSKKKSAIMAGGAGLVFGLLLGLLGLVAMTAADTAPRRRQDVETTPGGLQVVASIAEFPKTLPPQQEADSR